MIANLIAALLSFLPACPAPVPPTALDAPAQRQVAPMMLYVWAHDRCDLPEAIAIARCNGFVPTSRPMYRNWVPEAYGPAWIVYVRPGC